MIYAVVVLPITNDAGRNTGGEHALEFMAQGTGGRTYYPGLNAQLDKALTDLDTVIAINPSVPGGFFLRGQVYRRKGDAEKAIEDFTRAITQSPSADRRR